MRYESRQDVSISEYFRFVAIEGHVTGCDVRVDDDYAAVVDQQTSFDRNINKNRCGSVKGLLCDGLES